MELPDSYCLFNNVVDSKFVATVVVKDVAVEVQPGNSDSAASLLTTTKHEMKIEEISVLGNRQVLHFLLFCLM